MMLFSIMLQYKYYHFCITCYDISYIKNSLISAPAAPPPKQVKLAEMAKARQTSITSFTRLGGGDETRPLKINHPQVCIWILESVSFSGNLAFIMQKMPLNQLFHALSILLSPMPYYFVFQAVGISRRILQMIALDNEPFGVVNRIGFTRLMAHLVPNYLIPSPHYFTNYSPPNMTRAWLHSWLCWRKHSTYPSPRTCGRRRTRRLLTWRSQVGH